MIPTGGGRRRPCRHLARVAAVCCRSRQSRRHARARSPQTSCAGFPVELASRSYRATIAEDSSRLAAYNRNVSADDPTLNRHYLFGFEVAGRFVGFEWDDALTEELPGFRYLDIGGTAPTTEP
jgi:hypothetical protein